LLDSLIVYFVFFLIFLESRISVPHPEGFSPFFPNLLGCPPTLRPFSSLHLRFSLLVTPLGFCSARYGPLRRVLTNLSFFPFFEKEDSLPTVGLMRAPLCLFLNPARSAPQLPGRTPPPSSFRFSVNAFTPGPAGAVGSFWGKEAVPELRRCLTPPAAPSGF